jgi:hypothetical protein
MVATIMKEEEEEDNSNPNNFANFSLAVFH